MRTSYRLSVAFAISALVAATALAQPGPVPIDRFGSIGGLLQSQDVQKELKLSDEQIQKVGEVTREVRQKHREDFQKLRDLGPEERREKSTELMKVVSQDTVKALGSVLKPEQTKRLEQIHVQQQGIGAFSDPKIEKTLMLTDEQKEKIKAINADAAQEMRGLFQRGGGSFQESMKKMTALRKESTEKAVAVLTPDQKQTWKELTGAPFEVKAERPAIRPRGGQENKRDNLER